MSSVTWDRAWAEAYDRIFPILRDAVANRAVRQYLKCESLQPLFKLRG